MPEFNPNLTFYTDFQKILKYKIS